MGTVPVEVEPLETAALPRASRLLLEHVDGVFVLHLQLTGSSGPRGERGESG